MNAAAVGLFALAQVCGSFGVHYAGEAFRAGRFKDAFLATACFMIGAILFVGGLRT